MKWNEWLLIMATAILVTLFLVVAGCDEDYVTGIEGHAETDTDTLIFINNDYEPGNISFAVGDVEILFEWVDGKFNVVYDANNCTKAANTFFECMLPYLDEHIEAKAKETDIGAETYTETAIDIEVGEGTIDSNDAVQGLRTSGTLEIIEIDYTIIAREPNLLVVEVWDIGTWYSADDECVVETLRRAVISVPYVIEICEPKHLLVTYEKKETGK